jgi:signal transduction histidine kinase
MTNKLAKFIRKKLSKIPLKAIFIVPFVLQILIIVGLVGYFSFKNGQKAVKNLNDQLMTEIGDNIEDNLDSCLDIPLHIVENHQNLIKAGVLNLENMDAWIPYLWYEYQSYKSHYIESIQISNKFNEYRAVARSKTEKDQIPIVLFGSSGKQTNFKLNGYKSYYSYQKKIIYSTLRNNYYATKTPWYLKAIKEKKTVWTDIYARLAGEYNKDWLIAVTAPLFAENNREINGVASVPLNLSYIGEFLSTLKIGKTGQAFIIEKTGNLVATSTKELPLIINKNKMERLPATQSINKITQAAAKYIQLKSNNFTNFTDFPNQEFKFNHQKYFVSLREYKDEKGLNWLTVIVIPEADFMAEIQANTYTTIILCILALIMSIIIGILTTNFLSKPILELQNAAKKIAEGDWSKSIKISPINELNSLSLSFQKMRHQLGQSFTNLQELNQQLTNSEQKLSELLKILPIGVSIIDVTGNVIYVNEIAKQIFPQGNNLNTDLETLNTVYQVYKVNSNQIYPTEELPSVRALKGEKIYIDDIEVHHSNGKIIPLEVFTIPVFNSENKIIYTINIFQDITQRKEAENLLQNYNKTLEKQIKERTQELEKSKEAAEIANQAKSTFISNMSHELRTPLNAVLGFAQIISHGENLTPQQRKNIETILRSGEHLLNLINDILNLSKIEAEKLTFNPRNFDFHRLLNDLEEIFALKAKSKGLQLILQGLESIPQEVCTDQQKLRQVLINLLGNAIKFTERGSVTVRVSFDPPQPPLVKGETTSQPPTSQGDQGGIPSLIIEVEDTGAGIAPEEIGQIFEAFTQSETGKKTQEGTGLGLTISQNFIKIMGGEITVKSQVNQGTIFTVKIPVTEVKQTQSKPTKSKIRILGVQSEQNCYRILVVDDLESNRQLLMQLLQPLNFELKEAINGKEAISLWKKWQPDLIFMDVKMLVMDGYSAIQYIRSFSPVKQPKIIAVSASVLESEKEVILALGCEDFISKPIEVDELYQTLKNI